MDAKKALYIGVTAAVVLGLVGIWTLVLGQPLTFGVLVIAIVGFIIAAIDTCIGMGFGTIGTPVLLILGFASKLTVPSILISQVVAAGLGFAIHHRKKNVEVLDVKSKDFKIEMRLVGFGVIGTIIAVFVALSIPKLYMNMYIGLLVIAMGLILILNRKTVFSWLKINIISFVSGFNKAISGGGYGPVATTGLVVSGHPVKNSVGIALLSVAIIDTLAFAIYLLSGTITSFALPIFLIIGSVLGAQVGPKATNRLNSAGMRYAFAAVVIALGLLTIVTTIWPVQQLITLT